MAMGSQPWVLTHGRPINYTEPRRGGRILALRALIAYGQ